MVAPIHKTSDWMQDFDTVIDVRSPDEFAQDHIPEAVNLPVLSNEQRTEIGTLHKQVGAFEARRLGARLVSSNIARHLQDEVLGSKPMGWRPLLYCWRGGQRSASLARVLAEIGWTVTVLEGGYKRYRHDVMTQIDEVAGQIRPVLIQGKTGSAKTRILRAAAEHGTQSIDLEGLAQHRGSLLGVEPDSTEPPQRLFESLLFEQLRHLDLSRPVLIEAESSRIGSCHIPPKLWQMMQGAARISIEVPVQERVAFLLEDYAHLRSDPEHLSRLIDGMASRHGYDVTRHWQEHLHSGDWESLATALIVEHYDPAYARSSARKSGAVLGVLEAEELTSSSIECLAREVSALLRD